MNLNYIDFKNTDHSLREHKQTTMLKNLEKKFTFTIFICRVIIQLSCGSGFVPTTQNTTYYRHLLKTSFF